VCASGLKAVSAGVQEIIFGHADTVAIVGAEVMSKVPYFMKKSKQGFKKGD